MHTIELNNEAVKSLPEGFAEFSKMDSNNYLFLDSNLDLKIAYNFDNDEMGQVGQELWDIISTFSVEDVLGPILKFLSPFEFAYGGYLDGYFYNYYKFDGKKLHHIWFEADFYICNNDKLSEEEDHDLWSDLDNAIRLDGELPGEFLEIANELIEKGSFDVTSYDIDGNKIEV